MTSIDDKLGNFADTKSGKSVITLKDAGQLVGCGVYYQMYLICDEILKERHKEDTRADFYIRTKMARDGCFLSITHEAIRQGYSMVYEGK